MQGNYASLISRGNEVLWPRDTLFKVIQNKLNIFYYKYFQLMEKLQENMKEYQELQLMASKL